MVHKPPWELSRCDLKLKPISRSQGEKKQRSRPLQIETNLSFEDKRSPHFFSRRMNGNMALMMKTGFLKFIQELQETRLLPLITQSDCGRTDKRDCGTWSQRRLCLPCSQQCPVWWWVHAWDQQGSLLAFLCILI